MKKLILIFPIVILLLLSLSPQDKSSIAAIVNGEKIYVEDITTVVDYLGNDNYSYEEILNNSIDELLVIQEATKQGIIISDDEFYDYINHYKLTYPHFYNYGIKIYGENRYLEGLKNRLIYKEMQEFVINNILDKTIICDKDIYNYISYFEDVTIDDYNNLSDYEKETVNNNIKKIKEQTDFESWAYNLRANAVIEYIT